MTDTGLFDAFRRAAGTALAMLHSRVELASLELGEAARRLFSAVLVALFAVLLLLAAVVLATVWLVMLLWPTLGASSLALFALLYLVVGVVLLMGVRRRLDEQPALLEATMNELRSDAALMRGLPASPSPNSPSSPTSTSTSARAPGA